MIRSHRVPEGRETLRFSAREGLLARGPKAVRGPGLAARGEHHLERSGVGILSLAFTTRQYPPDFDATAKIVSGPSFPLRCCLT